MVVKTINNKEWDAFLVILSSIPAGHYTSYGALAHLTQVHFRQVQAWMRSLPSNTEQPWHRVMNGQSRISQHPKADLQRQLLASEGLFPNVNGRYDKGHFWPNV